MAQVSLDYPVDNVISYLNSHIKAYNEQPATISFAMLTNPPIPYIFSNDTLFEEYKTFKELSSFFSEN